MGGVTGARLAALDWLARASALLWDGGITQIVGSNFVQAMVVGWLSVMTVTRRS
jgi:hypothetical protein